MLKKERINIYRQLCGQENIPLHSQAWWLDAICGVDEWDVALAFSPKGKTIGALPYHQKSISFFSFISNPVLCTYANIYLNLPNNPDIKLSSLYTLEKKILGKLISKLPKTTFLKINMHPSLKNTLPFHWAAFSSTVRYTYRLDNLNNIDQIYEYIHYNIRRDMKIAADKIKVKRSEDIKALYELSSASYKSKNLTIPFSLGFFEKLFEKIKQNSKFHLQYAIDKNNGIIYSGLLTIYDRKCAYAILAGRNTEDRQVNTLSTLYWHSINEASKHVKEYDFEGSMVKEIEHVYSNFGAKRTPYMSISKFGNPMIKALATLLNKA